MKITNSTRCCKSHKKKLRTAIVSSHCCLKKKVMGRLKVLRLEKKSENLRVSKITIRAVGNCGRRDDACVSLFWPMFCF